jgi:hypothetical protein
VYQTSLASFFAPSISFAFSSAWPYTAVAPIEKKMAHKPSETIVVETEVITLSSACYYLAEDLRAKLNEYKKHSREVN